jgi:hypothetical protein
MNIMKAVKVGVLVIVAFVVIKIVIKLALGALISTAFTAAVIIGGVYLLYSLFKA